ncbi:hypothetical protein Kisp02_41010 [Kineosporia sp. NBRC 101731]|nr:hypothetical protein Kisp02_41010 [Kineosporia sp. NBRC 101731]
MARKSYSKEFRHQAVDLYRSTRGGTVQGIAADLGIGRDALIDVRVFTQRSFGQIQHVNSGRGDLQNPRPLPEKR